MQQLLYIMITGFLLIFLWTSDMMKQVDNPDFVAEIYATQMLPMFSQQTIRTLSENKSLDDKTRNVVKSLSEFSDAKYINIHNKSAQDIEDITINLPGVQLYILNYHNDYTYIYPDQVRVPLPDLPKGEDMQLTAIYDVQSSNKRLEPSPTAEQNPIILDSNSGSGKIIYYYFMGNSWVSFRALMQIIISAIMLISCGGMVLLTYLNWKKGVTI